MSTVELSETRENREPQADGAALRRDVDGHSDSPSLDRNARVRAGMIGEMIRESGHLRTSPFIVVAVLAMVYLDRAPLWPTILMIVGTAIFMFLGVRLRRAFDEANPSHANAEAWGLRYTALSGFVGLVWGPALAGYYDPASYPHQAFLALLTVGSLFAVIMHRALYPPAFIAFAVPTAVPLIAMFALNQDQTSLATALLGTVGLIGMLGWLRVLHKRFSESFALRFENTDLIERLEAAHRAAEMARQSAEAGDRTKSEFLATISHELRTPMNGIIGMTGLMLGTRLTSQQRSYGDIIRESADALLALINDILDLTKLESGRVDLDESPFELAQTIEGAVGLMAERAQAKGLQLVSHIGPQVPDIMTADAGRLRQVLLNLLSNAIKFTEEGSVELDVDLAPHSKSVLRVTVRDTGIGIEADVLPRLFKPFSQAGGISRRYGGTGLGLAISRRLIDAMGGDIDVESTPDVGTVFTVNLPIRSAKKVRRLDSLKDQNVIFVGPDDQALQAGRAYAADWHMNVSHAETPADAIREIQALKDKPVAVIDWRVKGGAGSLARQIRNNPAFEAVRLVLTVPVGVIETVSEDEDALFDSRLLQPLRRSAFHNALSGRSEGKDEARPVRRDPGRSGNSLRVLVVDDVAVNQKLAVSIVEMAGHEAVAAGSGREALQALRSLPYDLVLMDVEMPEMDGLEATRTIRQMPGATGTITIVAMTAHPGDEFIDRCMDAGMDAYLAKPLNAEELGDILREQAARTAEQGLGRGPLRVVGRLADAIGEETARELGQSFVDELDNWLDGLKAAADADNTMNLRHNAHSLKGAALNMGCRELAEAAASLTGKQAQQSHEIRTRLANVNRCAAAARKSILDELNQTEAG